MDYKIICSNKPVYKKKNRKWTRKIYRIHRINEKTVHKVPKISAVSKLKIDFYQLLSHSMSIVIYLVFLSSPVHPVFSVYFLKPVHKFIQKYWIKIMSSLLLIIYKIYLIVVTRWLHFEQSNTKQNR